AFAEGTRELRVVHTQVGRQPLVRALFAIPSQTGKVVSNWMEMIPTFLGNGVDRLTYDLYASIDSEALHPVRYPADVVVFKDIILLGIRLRRVSKEDRPRFERIESERTGPLLGMLKHRHHVRQNGQRAVLSNMQRGTPFSVSDRRPCFERLRFRRPSK